MINRLEGSKAMVIGCNSEVAAAISEELARWKVGHVFGTYYPGAEQSGAGLDDVTRRVSAHTNFSAIPLDQTKTSDIRRVMDEAVQTMGGLDILVTAAARQWDKGDYMNMPDEDFDAQIDVNLKGTLHAIREGARRMMALVAAGNIRDRGIVAVASVRGVEPYMYDPYDAAKAAVIHHVKGIAQLLGPQGIKIGAIAPGTVDVALEPIRHKCSGPEYRERWRELTPYGGTPVTPQMVGEATVEYLNARGSTGDVIMVSGGFHNMRPLPKRAGT